MEEKEREREGRREAAVNDKKFLRSDILKCHRAEVSLDRVEYKGIVAAGTALDAFSAVVHTLGIATQHATKKKIFSCVPPPQKKLPITCSIFNNYGLVKDFYLQNQTNTLET